MKLLTLRIESNLTKISIVIPTINEANNLPLLLSDLLIIPKEAEILIVDLSLIHI